MSTVPIALLMVFVLQSAGEPAPSYQASYSIFIRGDLAGTEKLEERKTADGRLLVASTHEMLISDGLETKRLAFETSLEMARDEAPLHYSYRYTSGESGDSCQVDIAGGRATRLLVRGSRRSETSTPVEPGFVLLDFNVYHHYDYLVRHYDLKAGGRQAFHNYIPVIGGPVPLALTRMEDTNLEYAGGSMLVRNFKVEFAGTRTGVVSTDATDRLVRLVIQAQDLEVVRADIVSPAAERQPGKAPGN